MDDLSAARQETGVWRNRFLALLDRTPVPTAICALQGTITVANPAMAELFNTRPARLKGRLVTDLLEPVVRRDYERLVRDLSTGRRNRRTLQVRWADRTGEVTVQAAADPAGVGLLITLQPNPPQPTLNSREAEILRMVALGETSAAIAAQLGLTADGVNYHLRKLTSRFGVPNRVALAAQVVPKCHPSQP